MRRDAAEMKSKLTSILGDGMQVTALDQTASAQEGAGRPGQQLSQWVAAHKPASIRKNFTATAAPARPEPLPAHKFMAVLKTLS